ncbi:MAG: NAD-dependent epimerase/dehydratase family protein [Parvularculaceae bacterium]
MAILVTGGAGYVGAHMLLALAEAGEEAIALDDLSSGARWMAPDPARLVVADVGERELVMRLLRDRRIREVIHFAGSTLVPESLQKPLHYYWNNTAKTVALLEACVACKVERFIFPRPPPFMERRISPR